MLIVVIIIYDFGHYHPKIMMIIMVMTVMTMMTAKTMMIMMMLMTLPSPWINERRARLIRTVGQELFNKQSSSCLIVLNALIEV